MYRSKSLRGIAAMIALIALIGMICTFSACSSNDAPQKLSEMEESVLLQHLADDAITIPAGLEISTIRDMIADLEADPDRSAPIVDWTVYSDFYEEVRDFVKDYYSMES